jgi:hypothetical protein
MIAVDYVSRVCVHYARVRACDSQLARSRALQRPSCFLYSSKQRWSLICPSLQEDHGPLVRLSPGPYLPKDLVCSLRQAVAHQDRGCDSLCTDLPVYLLDAHTLISDANVD